MVVVVATVALAIVLAHCIPVSITSCAGCEDACILLHVATTHMRGGAWDIETSAAQVVSQSVARM